MFLDQADQKGTLLPGRADAYKPLIPMGLEMGKRVGENLTGLSNVKIFSYRKKYEKFIPT
jgi:hypothetical protein